MISTKHEELAVMIDSVCECFRRFIKALTDLWAEIKQMIALVVSNVYDNLHVLFAYESNTRRLLHIAKHSKRKRIRKKAWKRLLAAIAEMHE